MKNVNIRLVSIFAASLFLTGCSVGSQNTHDVVMSDTSSAEIDVFIETTNEPLEVTASVHSYSEETQPTWTEETKASVSVEPRVSGYYIWEPNDVGITILKYTGNESVIRIPSEFEGYPVTVIGEYVFLNNTTAECIIVPDSVNEIQSGAFQSCVRLSEIILSKAITEIPRSCFDNCLSLEFITLPQGVTEIKERAFAFCQKLNTVSVLGELAQIDEDAFKYCVELVSVNNISECDISDNAFDHCRRINSIQYGDFYYRKREGGIEIADYAGDDENVIVPDTINGLPVISVGAYAFNVEIDENERFNQLCNVLHVSLPHTVKYLEEGAFCQCPRVISVDMPNELMTIGNSCFESCSFLERINIPTGVKMIGKGAFCNCRSLKKLSLLTDIKNLPYESLAQLTLEELVLPENLESIDKYALLGTKVSSPVYISDTVEYIDKEAFCVSDLTLYVDGEDTQAYYYAMMYDIPVVVMTE